MKLIEVIFMSSWLLALSNFGSAQGSEREAIEAGIVPLRYEFTTGTMNKVYDLKLVSGIYFNRTFKNPKWAWTNTLYGAQNKIVDDCIGCADHFSGIGVFTEYGITSGMRFSPLGKTKFPLQPIAQLEAHFTRTNYSGKFQGGVHGRGADINSTKHSAGLIGKFGLQISFFKRLSVTALNGFRIGWFPDKSYTRDFYRGGALTRFELRMGYLF